MTRAELIKTLSEHWKNTNLGRTGDFFETLADHLIESGVKVEQPTVNQVICDSLDELFGKSHYSTTNAVKAQTIICRLQEAGYIKTGSDEDRAKVIADVVLNHLIIGGMMPNWNSLETQDRIRFENAMIKKILNRLG